MEAKRAMRGRISDSGLGEPISNASVRVVNCVAKKLERRLKANQAARADHC